MREIAVMAEREIERESGYGREREREVMEERDREDR